MNAVTLFDAATGLAVAGIAGLAGWVLAIHGRVSIMEKTSETLSELLKETRKRQDRQESLCAAHQVERGVLDERVNTLIENQKELKEAQDDMAEDVRAIREYLIREDGTAPVSWGRG